MSNTVLRVENLGKKYIIGHQKQERYTALRDVVANQLRSLGQVFNGHKDNEDPTHEEFWALKDVSFEIKQGDRVGIIGRNGAGKSTLLKILSRITEPTSGKISIKGRVASLLEVGTGFHPELTGRENIFLNGAILGMDRVEIKRKFDEIVAFAEVEKFLDTPVKRYSSGMYVRLAFAVAAHLEPEILIVDEVLAVGDSQFQKKCLGKMEDIGKEGRTVLFVSHNMGAISTLTSQCLFLEKGIASFYGYTEETIHKYLSSAYQQSASWKAHSYSSHPIQIIKAFISSENSDIPKNELDRNKIIRIIVEYQVREPIKNAVIAVIIHASDGTILFSTEDSDAETNLLLGREIGNYRGTVDIPGGLLKGGNYHIRLASGIPGGGGFDNIEAISFTLTDLTVVGSKSYRGGYLLPILPWDIKKISPIIINP
jgi:lipopolysaccharide transport system ATP-binding protein